MHTKTTALSVAIGLALGSIAFSPLTTAQEQTSAQGQDQQVEQLQRMRVTGSRLTVASLEGSTPIAVIGRAEIERAGDVSIADVLRKTSFNSFGSHSETSGSNWQSQASMSLRGLGAERTLILVNGKRLPGSAAMGGGAANINAIPAAAVDRIEIMADGGSAVYGSDAVAGVVNIILKDNFDGVHVSVGGGIPSQEGGDEQSFSITMGTSGERGNILFSFEHDKKAEVYLRDRSYLRSQNLDSSNFFDMSGVSIFGRNIFHDGQLKPIHGHHTSELCQSTPGFVGVSNYPGLGTVCGFDFTADAAKNASIERNTVFVNGNYFINDDTTLNTQILLNRNTSFGRFAPAAGFFTIDPTTTGGGAFFDENGLDKDEGPASIYFRFNNVGTRDNNVTDFQADLRANLDGSLYTQSFGQMLWELGYQLNYSNSNETGTGYVFGTAASQLANDGNFVNGEFSADATDILSAGTGRETQMQMHQFYAGLQLDLMEIGNISVPLYIGTEFTTYDYLDRYDPQSEAGNIIGSAGNSASGDRRTYALYAESQVSLTDEVEMNLAARYDHYNDFGSAFSPKASLRYQPLDNLMFRTGLGFGFRAPTLSNLFAADSASSDFAKDYLFCQDQGISDAACPEQQYDVTRTANKDLDAEKSRSFNFGISYSPIDNLDLTMDYYNISIDDVISFNSLQNMINQERNTGQANPNITRDANGRITAATAGLENRGTLDTSGIDLKVGYKYDFINSTLRYDFAGSYVLDYSSPEFAGGPINNKVGRNGLPEYRFQTGVGLSFLTAHDIYLSADHIAGQAQDVDANYNKTGSISSHTTWNIVYNYLAPWDGKFTAGIRNLTDADPSFESDGVTYEEDLYSIQGRMFFVNYSQTF